MTIINDVNNSKKTQRFQRRFIEIREPFALYIHIPFCTSKCPYCDFYSVKYSKERVDQFWAALFRELKYLNSYVKRKQIRSIYIGGGTPSLLNPGKILELLNRISDYFKIPPGIEITIEANPSSLNEEKIFSYKMVGINRISIGIQSFNKDSLKLLGRQSSPEKNAEILKLINKYFDNYSVDLIFALPGQKIEDFKKDLDELLVYNPPHISLYNLEIHENTHFYDSLKKGKLNPISEELDAEMYEYAVKTLSENNYQHYEISNFSKMGYRAQHNYIYWQYQPYLALGPGAAGFDGSRRYHNLRDLDAYIDSYASINLNSDTEAEAKSIKKSKEKDSISPYIEVSKLSKEEKMAEYCFLKLRTSSGLGYYEFKRIFHEEFSDIYGEIVKDLKVQKLLIEKNGRIYLSRKAKLIANQVFLEFIL